MSQRRRSGISVPPVIRAPAPTSITDDDDAGVVEGEFFDGGAARGGADVVDYFRGHFGGGGAPYVFSLAEAGGEVVVD